MTKHCNSKPIQGAAVKSLMALTASLLFLVFGLKKELQVRRPGFEKGLEATPAATPEETSNPRPWYEGKITPPIEAVSDIDTRNWRVYRKEFDGILISFKYPPGYSLNDSDASSGIGFKSNDPDFQCTRMCHPAVRFYRLFEDATQIDGEQIDWFINEASRDYESKHNTLTLAKLNLTTGKMVLRKTGGVNYYYGIDNRIPYVFEDYRALSDDEVFAVLDSFKIISCSYDCPSVAAR